MKITLVKKILADGSPCAKCGDVLDKLQTSGQISAIDRIVVADERDPASEGMQLAARYEVNRAPFFIVERDGEAPLIYTVYLKFVRDILSHDASDADVAAELLKNSPDLDFL